MTSEDKETASGRHDRLAPSKTCFVIRINHTNAGFFAYFTFAINQLAHYEREGYTPVVYFGPWAENGPNAYYDPDYGENTWDYYFEPPAGFTYDDLQAMLADPNDPLTEADVVQMTNDELWHLHARDECSISTYPHGAFKHKTALDEDWYRSNRTKAHYFVQKYSRLKPHIVDLLEFTVARLFAGHHVLGIHMRGMDKGTAESTAQMMKIITPRQYVPYVDRYTVEHGPCKIFVATDQAQFVEVMRKRKADRVLSLNVTRSRHPINPFQQRGHCGGYKNAEEVLIDCLLLSRCNFLLKCCSAVGEFAIYFNPAPRCIDLNHMDAVTCP
jgi:hypothetical protein